MLYWTSGKKHKVKLNEYNECNYRELNYYKDQTRNRKKEDKTSTRQR